MRRAWVLLPLLLGAGCASGRSTHEQLQGVLWMQTAAEYGILAETTYRAAGEALGEALADPAWSAAIEQEGEMAELPTAVILDLDETVLDNSRSQGEQVKRRAPYSDGLWKEWVARKEATAVPGAVEFLARARSQGVEIFFVTNRTLAEEEATLANLTALGISTSGDHILSNQENGWTSDKTERRRFVARGHRILLLVGDDLGDFLPARLPPAARIEAARRHSDWWGRRWFLLPNPMYGSWDRSLINFESLPDAEVLRRKRALVRGFENAAARP